MARVVLMRAVNVGGRNRFRPSVLAQQLASLDVASVGAAGTFVIRRPTQVAEIRRAFERHLDFEPELLILEGRDLLALAAGNEFPARLPVGDVRRMLTVLAGKPARALSLPWLAPTGPRWQVQCLSVRGRFALSLWRPDRSAVVETNAALEKALGVRCTTRNWNTVEQVCERLRSADR